MTLRRGDSTREFTVGTFKDGKPHTLKIKDKKTGLSVAVVLNLYLQEQSEGSFDITEHLGAVRFK